MKFSDFISRVLDQLNASYGWKAPWSHLGNRRSIFDTLYVEYQKEMQEDSQDWQGRVESTALQCDSQA
jgi:hypothetical protein